MTRALVKAPDTTVACYAARRRRREPMLPIIRLSQAWLDAHGWTLAEGAALLELDQASASPAGANDACPNPKCGLPNTEYQGWVFEPDPATANSENERGRAYVRCICGTLYWYAALDDLNAPTEEARVRAASLTRAPVTAYRLFAASGSYNLRGHDAVLL
jgi:hypothetical protein